MCIKFWTQKRMLIERTFFIIVLVKKIPNSKLGYLSILFYLQYVKVMLFFY